MTHNNFLSAGQKPGIEIWRIEDFEPIPYAKKDYGKFYIGDSYIVLATRDRGRGSYSWDLHFWLGAETSQDESGAAAMFSVQLDDHLGGSPIQYREVQDYESQLFLSHFPNGVRYMPGGVASGFEHVDRNAATAKRLFQVKGKKNVRVKQVPVSFASLNNGDCFILDTGNNVIYVYVGSKSKRVERLKAIGAGNSIRDQDHGGRATVQVIDNYCSKSEMDDFFSSLGGGCHEDVADETAGGDDEAFESAAKKSVTLYRVSDDSGSVKVTEIGTKHLDHKLLDNGDCFILDTCQDALYVWIGRNCSPQERRQAMPLAQKFISERGYPKHTRVERIVSGAEPVAFREYFASWKNDGQSRIKRAFHCKLIADGRLITNLIYNCEQNDLEEDDTIIIDTGSVLYLWYGKDSDDTERSLSKQKAEKLQKFGNQNLLTIEQGNEPQEFKNLFPKWNANFWNTVQSYEQRRNAFLH